MSTILDAILAEKRKQIVKLKEEMNEVRLPVQRKKRSFIKHLQTTDDLAIIAEFKRASPSKGDINVNMNLQAQVLDYVHFGADAISILTDTPFFKGSFADLAAGRGAVDVPILCKDFIIDEVQMMKAKMVGADLILLIAAALDESRLIELSHFAMEHGLEVLMEVHNEAEMEMALSSGAKLIGVNNRDLKSFTVDLSVTETLGPIIRKEGAFLISESGIKSPVDVQRVIAAGANGVLVGETFMEADNLEEIFKGMKHPHIGGTVK
ncbi:indole-3-glycerol phosphate synthase TrpC [Cytobacillus solani]|uniref:Indole-3-glycerol phosphate synthase n=1 Tax=Cytobacillus solani TaxID=1637975 RepID=A0A0Q3SJY9_9BACI|nr:indole-3-glycerol phosphate synthase TrpC [Cytobacillus solani]KOP82972.1 indole-3-glycerol phosphate synthase [Bacillus sp. FJAT-21945]KQL19996.1 indole-3-glycerol phosphate synthase [Cytobacillus solani]USK53240.1 indole-3-glycerol phosphate synthase TrpC [Cytobacillus solani]